ncbi:helix-turn-helix domain-containing protein [Amedibacillus sp. YH-ame10]
MKKVTEINLTVGKAIRDGLQHKKLTQGDLANIVGSTQRSISSYVNGTAQPPLDILVNICRALEINLNQILRIPDYETPYRLLTDPKEIAYLKILSGIPDERKEEYLEILLRIRGLLK